MIAFIGNIVVALLVAGALAFVAYFIVTQLQNSRLGPAHYVGLGVLFLLISYQTFRFMGAWDEKTAIENILGSINSLADNAIEFIDEVDRQNGGNGQTSQQIKDVINNPLMQKGLSLFGIDVGVDGQMTVEMGEKLKSEYNWYMFRRVCWILGFMISFVVIAMFLPTRPSSHYHTRSTERVAQRPACPHRHSSRRR